MERQTFRWIRASVCFYGILTTLIFGGFFISLFAHGDLMLVQALHCLDWMAGDIALLLTILWGILFALTGLTGRSTLALSSLFLALIIVILVGWINWQMSLGPWGVLIVLLLFFLPSLATQRALLRLQNGSKGDAY